MRRLFVGNISYAVREGELRALFASVGTVAQLKLFTHRDSGRSRGFGFVEMSTEEEARSAIERLNGRNLGGRILAVVEARERDSLNGGRAPHGR